MTSSVHIGAVTVNHNTSHFVELMLRTFFLTNDLTDTACEITILDNGSDDAALTDLHQYCATQHLTIHQTGFDASIAAEKHGVAFANFIRDYPAYTHYLFLDADMWFIEPHTLAHMVDELMQAPSRTFANQARILGYYAGRIIEGRDGIAGATASEGKPAPTVIVDDRTYTHIGVPRCSPVCSLITNTPRFRHIVETVDMRPKNWSSGNVSLLGHSLGCVPGGLEHVWGEIPKAAVRANGVVLLLEGTEPHPGFGQ